MSLDDPNIYPLIDPQNMRAEIDGLPGQLVNAWQFGQTQFLPTVENISNVVIAGMGCSATGAELLAAYAEPVSSIPIHVHNDYGLPAWAQGPETLVLFSSYSGETEEVLSAFEQATEKACTRIVMATGGKLADAGRESGADVWQFEHPAPQRAALGYAFGLPLAILSRLGLVPDPKDEINEAVAAMRAQQVHLQVEVPAVQNPAKRYAGQLMGRWVVFLGAEFLIPVARRWKVQVNELAKAWAQAETLPEADHNVLAGLAAPEELYSRTMTIFLNAPACHPRNTLRSDLTRKAFMLEGVPTDFYLAQGETRLAQQWTALHFGDYMAYYLATAYGLDPTPVPMIEQFKAEMEMF